MQNLSPCAEKPAPLIDDNAIDAGVVVLVASRCAERDAKDEAQQGIDHPTVGENGNSPAGILAGDFLKTGYSSLIFLPAAFPFRNEIVRVPGHESFIFLREFLRDVLKSQALENTHIAFAQRGVGLYGYAFFLCQGLCRLHRPPEVARVDRFDRFRGKVPGDFHRLLPAFITEFGVDVPLKTIADVPGGLPVADDDQLGRSLVLHVKI